MRHSDVLIALTGRDSALLEKIYGRRATHISAMALDDRAASAHRPAAEEASTHDHPYLLFVGGAFYANRMGIDWFIRNVTPRLRMKTIVVGKGLEALRPALVPGTNVEIVGAVERLADWYHGAYCVIAPIFDGSGMKTKVAEAMMYGKKVIGTPAAFVGYEEVAERAGWICATADEFLDAINRTERLELLPFDPQVRALYDQHHSYSAARSRIARILEPLAWPEPDRLSDPRSRHQSTGC